MTSHAVNVTIRKLYKIVNDEICQANAQRLRLTCAIEMRTVTSFSTSRYA